MAHKVIRHLAQGLCTSLRSAIPLPSTPSSNAFQKLLVQRLTVTHPHLLLPALTRGSHTSLSHSRAPYSCMCPFCVHSCGKGYKGPTDISPACSASERGRKGAVWVVKNVTGRDRQRLQLKGGRNCGRPPCTPPQTQAPRAIGLH